MSKDLKIEFVKISKKFGGVQALENVTFSINMNEIHSIVGENGAGKSTLLRILGGDIRPTSGDIYLRGRKVYFNEPKDARVHGISVIYQELKLCPNMNALQNAFLGNEKKTLYGLNIVEMQKELLSILESLGVKNINIFAPVKLLSLSVQQILEISRALLHGAEIIVMDEPTSALTLEEASNLLRIIKELKNIGKTIVYVSHRLEEVMNISDNITVLRDGKYIATVKKNEVTKRDLVRLMVGGVRDYEKKRISGKVGNKILEVRNLTKVPYFYNINFYIREGEIVGLSGLEGCGRYEVGRALAGLITPNTGEILYNGKKIRIMNSSFALKNGICLLPRDRKGEGLFSLLNILYNLSFVKLQEDIVLNGKKYEKVALNYIDKLRIKCSSLRQNINELSGGNQQKCVVSRCLSINPIIYILEEPTRGIDIKTKVEIFEIMDNVVKKGSGILLISSELQELINICDRILVMYSGRIVADLKREEFSSEKIMMYATGAVGSKC